MIEATGRDILPRRTHFGRRQAPQEEAGEVITRTTLFIKYAKYFGKQGHVILALSSVFIFLILYFTLVPKNEAALIRPALTVSLENQYDAELISLLEDYIADYYQLSDTRKKVIKIKTLKTIEDIAKEKEKAVAAKETPDEKSKKGRFRKKTEDIQAPKPFVSKEERDFLNAQKTGEKNLGLIAARYRSYIERKLNYMASEFQNQDAQKMTKDDRRIAELILHLDGLGHLKYRAVIEDIINTKHITVMPRTLEDLMPQRVLQMTAHSSLRAMTNTAVVKLTDQKTLSIDLPLQKDVKITPMYRRQELRLNVLMAKDILEQGDFSESAKMSLGFAVGAYLKAMQQDPHYTDNNLFLEPSFKTRWRTVTDYKILSWLADLTYTKAIEVYPKEKGMALLVK